MVGNVCIIGGDLWVEHPQSKGKKPDNDIIEDKIKKSHKHIYWPGAHLLYKPDI